MPKLHAVDRASMHSLFNDAGWTKAALMKKFKCSRKVVRKWIHKPRGDPSVFMDSTRSGRPRSLTTAEERALVRELTNSKLSLKGFCRKKKVSRSSVKRHIRKHQDKNDQIRPYKPRKVIHITPLQQRIRFDFVCSASRLNLKTGVTYGDEKPLDIFHSLNEQNEVIWRPRSRRNEAKTTRKHVQSPVIHTFCAVNWNGKSKPYFFIEYAPYAVGEGVKRVLLEMNSDTVQKAFGDVLIPFLERTEMRYKPVILDGARPHCSASTVTWLEENKVDTLGFGGSPRYDTNGYPPNSPDFNAIELVFAEWQHRLDQVQASSVEELIWLAKREWESIPMTFVRSCIERVERRHTEVFRARGRFV